MLTNKLIKRYLIVFMLFQYGREETFANSYSGPKPHLQKKSSYEAT
jgi:hypothetical protein